jgi:hypothetical protein
MTCNEIYNMLNERLGEVRMARKLNPIDDFDLGCDFRLAMEEDFLNKMLDKIDIDSQYDMVYNEHAE